MKTGNLSVILWGVSALLAGLKPAEQKEKGDEDADPEEEVNKCSVHAQYLFLPGRSVELFLNIAPTIDVIVL